MLAILTMGCRIDLSEDDTTDTTDGDSAIDSNTTCTDGERTCEGTVINVCENGNLRWMRNCADAGLECEKGECIDPEPEPELEEESSSDLCNPNPCHGHGFCDPQTGLCVCDNPYMVEDCSACMEG